jgi:DNA polymerase III delta prime subunit
MSRVQPPLTNIGNFYKQIDDFKQKLIGILQELEKTKEIVEINKYYDKLLLAKKANARKAIELLYEYGVKVYASQILLRQEKFFLEKSADSYVTEEIMDQYSVNHKDLLFVEQIKGIWEYLQPSVRTNIWNYVQIICLLAENVVGGNVLANEKLRLKANGQL